MPLPLNSLNTEEANQLLMLLDNSILLSALRKVWEEDREYWRNQGEAEALKNPPSSAMLIQYASRSAEAAKFEHLIRRAVGL